MTLDLSHKLVVAFTDDDEDDFLIYNEAVKSISENIQLLHFTSCETLLDYLKQHAPNLIFLDINLGGTNGVECINLIRSRHNSPAMPIVVHSTEASQSVINDCLNSGANYYMPKPKSFGLLEQGMRQLFCRDW